MSHLYRTALCLLLVWACTGGTSFAQSPSRLKVTLTCTPCDRAVLQREMPFVEFLDPATAVERDDTDVVVVITPADVEGATESEPGWTMMTTGRGAFSGRDRTVQASGRVGRLLKLLLAEYAAETEAGPHLDIAFVPPAAQPGAPGQAPVVPARDPWNAWVFRINASTFMNGESSSSDRSYSYRTSANRTTDQWKLRVSAYRNESQSSFTISDTMTVKSRVTDWTMEGLAVRSLGPKWSLAAMSSLVGSSFSNSRRVARLEQGIEFDWFPYAESSRRSLTFTYTLGVQHYDYDRETIFSKMQETVGTHALRTSLGLRQPWGQVGVQGQLLQQLTAPDRTRITLSGNVSVRLLGSLTLTGSGNYQRIRDQFTLVKGNATDEEVLLRQRQLATGYRYSFSVGFGYAFGALSNTTVNPRFGGGI